MLMARLQSGKCLLVLPESKRLLEILLGDQISQRAEWLLADHPLSHFFTLPIPFSLKNTDFVVAIVPLALGIRIQCCITKYNVKIASKNLFENIGKL